MHPWESYRFEQFYSSTGIAFWYFLWYYNPRIVIWIILLIQWYIIFLLSSYIFYSSCILWACNGSSTSNLTEICSMHKIVGLLHSLDLVCQHDWFEFRLDFYSIFSCAMAVLFQIWQRNVVFQFFEYHISVDLSLQCSNNKNKH